MFRSPVALAAATAILVAACAAPAPAAAPAQPSGLQTPSATAPAATATAVPSAPATGTPAVTPTAPASVAVVDPATIDPCSLVSAARISEVLGEQVADGVLKESEGSAECFFDVPGWPGVVMSPQDPGVSIRIYREPKTMSAYDPYANGDQQEIAEVDGLGDGAWWRHHVELPNVHIDTDSAVLNVFAEPLQFSIAFTQIPNPVGVDKAVWLANATELANDVLGALGR